VTAAKPSDFAFGYYLAPDTRWWPRLLEGLDVERVTLTMRPEPEAAPAQAAYAAWGYRKVGVSHPWEDAPYYDCMVRKLR